MENESDSNWSRGHTGEAVTADGDPVWRGLSSTDQKTTGGARNHGGRRQGSIWNREPLTGLRPMRASSPHPPSAPSYRPGDSSKGSPRGGSEEPGNGFKCCQHHLTSTASSAGGASAPQAATARGGPGPCMQPRLPPGLSFCRGWRLQTWVRADLNRWPDVPGDPRRCARTAARLTAAQTGHPGVPAQSRPLKQPTHRKAAS